MVSSRSVPQQTAQIFSALAGQKRPVLRLSQIGQSTNDPPATCGTPRISRRNDFIVEAARGNDEEQRTHQEQCHSVPPEMAPSGAPKNDAAGDVDEIGGGNEEADGVEKLGHGFARKDVSGEKDARKNGEKRELHGLRLRGGFTGNQNADRERDEDVRKRQEGQQEHVPVNRHEKQEAHRR